MLRSLLVVTKLSVLGHLRRQVLIFTLVMLFVMLLIPAYINLFSLGVRGLDRMVKDFGVTVITYYGVFLSIALASSAIPREIEMKTIYPLLAKPVPRIVFVFAHWLAVTAIAVGSMFALVTVLLVATKMMVGAYDIRLYLAIFFAGLEVSIIAAACVAASTKVSPPLAATIGAFIFILGGLSNTFIEFFLIEDRSSTAMVWFVQFLKGLLPNLNLLHVKSAVVQALEIPVSYTIEMFFYSMGWSSFMLMVGNMFFVKRDF